MTDEFLLRQTATDLFYRFTRLEEAKTTTMPSPEIKTGGALSAPSRQGTPQP
ncbi:hypothetical protein CIP101434_02040 [Corynebacterium diphtheriae]|nr:hypothetical protein CIP101280_01730 [Corynebacterium diphtheriae]CAB0525283.1 hypothetical protein CIP101434_02040 [Corynebacterium diphtheriae]